MINATKKWIFLKISGAILVPLMLWFIFNLITIYDQEYISVLNFFTNLLSKFCINSSLQQANNVSLIIVSSRIPYS